MNGPQNGIMGEPTPIDLPQMQVPEEDLKEEKAMASFSKSPEFKRLKKTIDERITFYQSYLPNGAEVGLDVIPSPEDWRVANRVIGELKAILNSYDIASEIVAKNNG